MMHTNQALYDHLRSTLAEVEIQIKHVKNDIALQYPEQDREKLNVWYWTRKPNGDYVLADLLIAKAQIVSAMATLKAAEVTSRQKR